MCIMDKKTRLVDWPVGRLMSKQPRACVSVCFELARVCNFRLARYVGSAAYCSRINNRKERRTLTSRDWQAALYILQPGLSTWTGRRLYLPTYLPISKHSRRVGRGRRRTSQAFRVSLANMGRSLIILYHNSPTMGACLSVLPNGFSFSNAGILNENCARGIVQYYYNDRQGRTRWPSRAQHTYHTVDSYIMRSCRAFDNHVVRRLVGWFVRLSCRCSNVKNRRVRKGR